MENLGNHHQNIISNSKPVLRLVLCLTTVCAATRAEENEPLDVGSERQLFVDRHLIDSLDEVDLKLHHPVRREIVIRNEHPWEKYGVSYLTTFRDGDKFRAWYRCDAADFDKGGRSSFTAYAESVDGIHWVKPKLGLIEFAGSKENNLVWKEKATNLSIFKDGNPVAPPEERYKAIARAGDIFTLISPDGLHWKRAGVKPILTDRPFDSHNIAFWDERHREYVIYARGIQTTGKAGIAMSKSFKEGVRGIRRTTSPDFLNWSSLELIDTGEAPLEHLYTNAAIRYQRAPGYIFLFPSRYADTRKPNRDWKHQGVNDIVLLSSRDGRKFARTFMEAFVRPGLDPRNWHDRSLYLERGILQTAPAELSLYAMQNWRTDSVHIQRLTLRPDGFASVHAGYRGGELLTRPLRFAGKALHINFSTSSVGSLKVELQEAGGKPIPGYTLAESTEIYGDKIDAPVSWKAGGDLSHMAGRTIRLRFAIRDADLFAIRFGE